MSSLCHTPSLKENSDFSGSEELLLCANAATCSKILKFSLGGDAISRSKSEPVLEGFIREDNVSVHSEPIQKFSEPQKFKYHQNSIGDDGHTQNLLETESEPSFSELKQRKSADDQSHRDPVIVFWEKSDKRDNIDGDFIVKFSLPGGEVFTQSFSKLFTIAEIKKAVAEMFKVPYSILQLVHNASTLLDCMCISDIAIERFGTVTFHLSSLDSDRYPLVLNNVYPDIPTNDVLTVMIRKGEHLKQIIVEIENRAISKPFLGGYRHRVTKLEYHHAFTQTAARQPKQNITSRNTQTPGMCRVVETSKAKSTQTSLIIDETEEGTVIIGDPERRLRRENLENKAFEDKVLLIQRNLRSWLVRKMMLKMKEEYKRCIQWEKQQQVKIREEKEAQKLEKKKAQTKPETRGHFELLYHNLEEWRKVETDRINNLGSIALRKSEAFSMLEMEIQYINSIEKQRIQLKTMNKRRDQEKILEKTASPIKWRGCNGQILSLDSLGTQKAFLFKTLYENLLKVDVTVEERIGFLGDVKKAVLDEENSLVPELVSLLDREHHILLRDIKHSNIDTLRDRINYVFLEYIKDPTVNPEARKYRLENLCQRVQTYKCLSCQNVLPYYKFTLHSKAHTFRKCHNCSWLREIGGPRVDINPIRHILNAVRREELKQSFYTSVALIMQEQDFYHLIINIWLGHSAIGGSGNLEELRLGRWDYSQSWSPWNCILLTAAELKAHLRFSNPDQIYSSSFVKKIKQRHQMGRIYFSELAAYAVRRTSDSTRVSKMIQNFNASKAIYEKYISKQDTLPE